MEHKKLINTDYLGMYNEAKRDRILKKRQAITILTALWDRKLSETNKREMFNKVSIATYSSAAIKIGCCELQMDPT